MTFTRPSDIEAFPNFNSSGFLMKSARIPSLNSTQGLGSQKFLSNDDVVYLFEPKDALVTAQIMERRQLQRLVIMN